jgi:hypothetical protein
MSPSSNERTCGVGSAVPVARGCTVCVLVSVWLRDVHMHARVRARTFAYIIHASVHVCVCVVVVVHMLTEPISNNVNRPRSNQRCET